MRGLLAGLLILMGVSVHAEYSSYFYWQIDSSVVDFSYAQLRLNGDSRYFTIGDTPYTMVGAETSGLSELGNTTSAVAANLGAFAASDYSFLVEVFGVDDGLLAWSDTFSYDEIAGSFVYSDMGTALSGTAYGVSITNVPEPNSAIMLIAGLAILSLRRKKRHKDYCLMTLFAIFSCQVSGLFAAANDVVLTFSTVGPDTYADGTTVLDGESYALIWTKTGETFGGIAADGQLIGEHDKFVLAAGIAKDGKCPTMVFEIEAADYAAYEGGSFALYLLDTRIKDEEGNVSVAGANSIAIFAPGIVNAIGVASAANESSSSALSLSLASDAAVALNSVGILSKIEMPTITALKIEDATVSLTVKDLSCAAEYFVVPGVTPNSFETALKVKPENGTFVFPKPKGSTFFKVIGIRKFQ